MPSMFNKYYKNKSSKTKKPKSVSTKPSTQAVVKIAKEEAVKAIDRKAESKIAVYSSGTTWSNLYGFGDSTNFPLYNIKIMNPDDPTSTQSTIEITQDNGELQDGRIGNKVATVSGQLNLILRMNPSYNDSTNYNCQPGIVKIYFFKLRGNITDTITGAYSTMSNIFYQNGGNSAGMSGTLGDFVKFINTDAVQILKTLECKLGNSNFPSSFGVSSPANSVQAYQNNDFKLFKLYKLNITSMLNKTYRFNDGTNTPSTRRVYMACVPYRIDGSLYTSSLGVQAGQVPLQWCMSYEYKFKDY